MLDIALAVNHAWEIMHSPTSNNWTTSQIDSLATSQKRLQFHKKSDFSISIHLNANWIGLSLDQRSMRDVLFYLGVNLIS